MGIQEDCSRAERREVLVGRLVTVPAVPLAPWLLTALLLALIFPSNASILPLSANDPLPTTGPPLEEVSNILLLAR